MKIRILFPFLFVCIFFSVHAQIMPWEIKDYDTSKKNKNMQYDGESKFLFFFEDYEEISPDMIKIKKQKLEARNEEIYWSNEQRQLFLENNFEYPFEIIYPKALNIKRDSIDYRYIVVLKSASSTPMYMNANGSWSGGGLPSYSVSIYDIQTKTRKKVFGHAGDFNFASMVKAIKDKFIENPKVSKKY